MGNFMVVKLKNLFLLQPVNLEGISQSKTLPTYQTSLFLGKSMHYFGMLFRNNPSKSDFIKDKVSNTETLKTVNVV